MPYERPGAGVYVTATKVTPHNAPCTEGGFVGVAVKQKAQAWTAGFIAVPTIAIGEAFHIRDKGEKQVPNTGIEAATLGAPVWINTADNTLALAGPTSGTKLRYGRVTGVPGDAQGCPATAVRIDLDQKDSFA